MSDNNSDQAQIRIPDDWLMPGLDLETVKQTQRPDSNIEMESGLKMAGVEIVVERRWLREPFWSQIAERIDRGYVFRRTGVQIVIRADRRERKRQPRPAAN